MKNGLVARPDGTQEWYKYGKLHRLDGPAVVHSDGTQEYWEYGLRVDKSQVNKDLTMSWNGEDDLLGNLHLSLTAKDKLRIGDECRKRDETVTTWHPIDHVMVGTLVANNQAFEFRRLFKGPFLRPVTVQTVLELEKKSGEVILFRKNESLRCIYSQREKYWRGEQCSINPLEWDWFINVSTIP